MKNTKFVILLNILILIFTNCKKEETSLRQLSGTWQLTEASSKSGIITPVSLFAAPPRDYHFTGKDFEAEITFNKASGEFSSIGKYTQDRLVIRNYWGTPDSTYEEVIVPAFDSIGNWFENNSEIKFRSFNSEDERKDAQIIEMNDLILVLDYFYKDTEVIENWGGINEQATIRYRLRKKG